LSLLSRDVSRASELVYVVDQRMLEGFSCIVCVVGQMMSEGHLNFVLMVLHLSVLAAEPEGFWNL
jgi:hypothetical protein